MKYNKEIHKKAKKKLKVIKYREDCFNASICPKCSDNLDKDTDDHGFTDAVCEDCGMKYML